jgi:hypothetical protein
LAGFMGNSRTQRKGSGNPEESSRGLHSCRPYTRAHSSDLVEGRTPGL